MVAAVQGEMVGAASGGASGKLIVPPVEAAQWVQTQIERGQSIRKLRLRYADELEKARAKKAEWVTQTYDVLKGMFDSDGVAQEFNSCDTRVLPDFAELHLFIEAFYDEMEQRLKKLQLVHRRIPVGRHPAPARSTSVPRSGRAVHATPVAVPPPETPAASAEPAPPAAGTKQCVLFQHGECDDAMARVEQFVEMLGLEAVRVDFGAALDRLGEADDVCFAMVVTPAAQGVSNDGRALFQLGCCVGKVGASRACIVATEGAGGGCGGDVCGVACVGLDPADGWQLQVARQMKRAGVEVDLNRIC